MVHRAWKGHLVVPSRAKRILDRLPQAHDRPVEEIEVDEDVAHDQGVLVREAALQRLAQSRQPGARAPAGKLGQHLGVGGAANERVEHGVRARPARLADCAS